MPRRSNVELPAVCSYRLTKRLIWSMKEAASVSQHFRLASFVLVNFITALNAQDSSAQWKDPPAHSTRFVSVDKNVDLEVLDWGGTAGLENVGAVVG